MSKIHHQNVIQYYESFIEHGRLNIVMEFAPGGDLGQAIAAKLARREYVFAGACGGTLGGGGLLTMASAVQAFL